MSNAELFKEIFGIYAEEFWAYPEEKMLDWLTSNVPDTNVGDTISRAAALDAMLKDKTRDEALSAVAQFLMGNKSEFRFKAYDGKKYRLCVEEIKESDNGRTD